MLNQCVGWLVRQTLSCAVLHWKTVIFHREIILVSCISQSQVILLSAGDRVAGLPLLQQQQQTAACGAPPQSLLPERHRVGGQRHGDELSGRQEHRPVGLPSLEQTDRHGGPEGPHAQDQD